MKWAMMALILPVYAFAAPTPESASKQPLTTADWQYVVEKVSLGEKTWINVVPKLAYRANRSQAEQLEEALATALPITTKEVLYTLNKLDSGHYPEMNGTNIVCVLKVATSGKGASEYYAKTRLALMDYPAGANCLWNLEGIWEEVNQSQK